jgi:metal-dependent amidase/aminoacylase/carboxypeptidase family protein
VRAFSTEVLQAIERRIGEIADGVARAFGARARLDFRTIFHPTVNDPEQAQFAAEVCAELVGQENVVSSDWRCSSAIAHLNTIYCCLSRGRSRRHALLYR